MTWEQIKAVYGAVSCGNVVLLPAKGVWFSIVSYPVNSMYLCLKNKDVNISVSYGITLFCLQKRPKGKFCK